MTILPTPAPGRDDAVAFVADHLDGLFSDGVAGSERFDGGQVAADEALARFDVEGYASRRNEVYPQPRRGASGLSPYLRHGLLTLSDAWERVEGGPERDIAKFRNELLWQEYSRHWYLRLGRRSAEGVKHEQPQRLDRREPGEPHWVEDWDRNLACLELSVGELEDDGWLVNQSRMWLASHLAVRRGVSWQQGEDYFFRHLLDGSRAANRLGWQWTTGVGSAKTYGFSRWQVEERAPGLCASCEMVHNCPIEDWPDQISLQPIEQPVELRSASGGVRGAGPTAPVVAGEAEAVWLTAESLGDRDPALAAHPELPAVFVFDRPLLKKLQLSSKRLVFLTESLADLATRRPVELHLGSPVDILRDRPLAATFAPVPGFASRARVIDPVALHPWPWLTTPNPGSVASFSAWLKARSDHQSDDALVAGRC